MCFFSGLFMIVGGAAIVVAEIVCITEHSREFFFHLLYKRWENFKRSRLLGKIPDDVVKVLRIEKKNVTTLSFIGKLDKNVDAEAVVIIQDKAQEEMELAAPLSLFDEFVKVLDYKQDKDVVFIDKKISRNDFNLLMITHYNNRIEQIKSWED